ncbi:hypothetical protein NLU13_7272 [Sarocladium strictum]|uniref:Signal peptidase complex subunit 1 n=1 Tax=Sarocladium strictum TaxID=5046 RepID=A0AA39GD75_SARSR|nr:hypothetical protein NLU13_7272 [Sarocladium strictum]
MADQLLDQVRDVVEGEIDFNGQRRAELFSTLFLALTGLFAFNIGWVREDIALAVYTGLGGTALTFLLVVPPWPIYKKDPVKFLPAGEGLYKVQ